MTKKITRAEARWLTKSKELQHATPTVHPNGEYTYSNFKPLIEGLEEEGYFDNNDDTQPAKN